MKMQLYNLKTILMYLFSIFILNFSFSQTDLSFEFTVTDANMTVQVGSDVCVDCTIGDLVGAFFENDSGNLQCAGYQPWTGDQLAIAVMASESGMDNGMAAGETIQWALYDTETGSSYLFDSTMNSDPPFSDSFISNGFGQVLTLSISTGSTCTDDDALMTPIDCATAVMIFTCDGQYNEYDISAACPVTCDSCPSEEECLDDDALMTPIDCATAVMIFTCDGEYNGYDISAACPVTCDSCPSEEECLDDDTTMDPIDCATAVMIFTCDGEYNGYNISDACPVSCDSCDGNTTVLGCTDTTAENYNALATQDDGSCTYPLPIPDDWSFTITDANMTIQVGANILMFNGEEPPIGSLVGVFFTNDSGNLQCAGYQPWTGDQLAIAAMASESGLDNGFAAGEEFTWGLQIGGQSFSADISSMNSSPPFSDIFIANGFGQLLNAEFTGELTSILGCTDESAINYNSEANLDDGSCYNLVWEEPNTGANATIAVTPEGPNVSTVTFNGEDFPVGAYLGVFFTDDNGQYSCGGLEEWTGDNIALAAWGNDTQTVEKDGFDSGEEYILFAYIYGQTFQASSVEWQTVGGFSNTYGLNAFGMIISASFEGELSSIPGCTDNSACNYNSSASFDDGSCTYAEGLYDCNGDCNNDIDGDLICDEEDSCPNDSENDADADGVCESDELNGCTDDSACNYDSLATEDDGSCISPTTWYFDTDGDGLGDSDAFSMESCSNPSGEFGAFSENNNDNCPNDPENDADGDGICESDEINGCTDESACNYDSLATDGDGSCEYNSCADCNGVPFGDSLLDECGTCDNDTSNDCVQDCAGVFGGDSVLDECGTCDNDSSNDCIQDCAGVWGGTSTIDNCGTCDADASNDCIADCAGVFGGDSVLDECGTCDADASNDCIQDCAGVWGGTATTDECGTCDNDSSNDCIQDCAGVWGGTATIDNCGICDDDASNDCIADCAGVFGGDSVLDECGTCDNDASNDCVQDCAGVWGGTATTDECGTCDNDPSNDCIQDCAGVWGGTATIDNCGICDDDASNDCIADCAGVFGGDSVLDECGTCDNDASNDCVQDCAGVWGGTATTDECGTCDNDPSNDCIQDCAGVFGGDLVLDDCGDCGGDNSSCTGCADSLACNYFGSTIDDGSCEYPEEGYDCNGELLPVDSPWGNNLGCDPFNNHTVAFTAIEGLEIGDYVGLFFTDNNGDLVFSQGTEFIGGTFFFTVCGDDETTAEKDGFSVGENFVWQIYNSNSECSTPLEVEYLSDPEMQAGQYAVNGISQIIGFSFQPLEIGISVEPISCNGANDASIDLFALGGAVPYLFTINGEEYSSMINNINLAPGSYSLTVIDAYGCSITEDITIEEPDEIEISGFVTNVSCNGDEFNVYNDGSIQLNVSGGSGNYSYSWTGPTGPLFGEDLIEFLYPGTYSVIVTDQNDVSGNCLVTMDFEVLEPEELTIIGDVSNISCFGAVDGSIDITVSGGSGNYSYAWNAGTSYSEDLSDLGPGIYTIVVMDEDSIDPATGTSSCLTTQSFEILGYDPLTISETHTNVSCNGAMDGSIVVSVSGGTGDYTYVWQDMMPTDEDYESLGPGVYSVVVTDGNGCSVSIEVEITEPEELTILETHTNVSCNGGNDALIDLTVSGGVEPYNYFWSNGETIEDISNLGVGFYSVLVTDSNDCTETLEFEITEPEELIISETHTNVSCNGAMDGSIVVSVSGGTGDYTYVWQDMMPTDEDYESLGPGIYSVVVTDENDCSVSIEVEITEPEPFNISFASNAGEYVDCNSGQLSVIVEGGTAPYSYEWDNGSTDPNLFDLCAGDYSVTVTDANGCSISQTGTVELLIPEGWEVNEFEVYHEIVIPADADLLLDGVDLNIGDFIGVFYVNFDGGLSCGGYTIWEGEETSIVAYGFDGDVFFDGFDVGEQFQWKVYNGETHSGFAIYDDLYENERYFNSSGLSGIHGAIFSTSQTIPLNENPFSDWDMISTYMESEDDVETIMSPIINNFIIIKDASGLAYWPAIPVTTLDFLNTEEAYAIKTWAPGEVTISGDFMQPEFSSNSWQSGWNYISYPRYWSNSVETALSSVVSNIKLLKDDSGNIVWPELGISTIENMEAGEGYLLKLYDAQEFSYDSNSDFYPEDWASGNNNSEFAQRYGVDLEYYEAISKTSSNMTIGFPKSAFSVEEGDELAVFDELGNMVGVSKLTADNNYVVVWGNDEDLVEKSGLLAGEKMSFQLWRKSSNEIFTITPSWKEGDDLFSINGINIAESITIDLIMEDKLTINCYPNPASDYINIELNSSIEVNSGLYLIDNLGKVVYYSSYLLNSGVNRIVIPLDDVSKGIYYLEVKADNFVQRVKIDVLY